ncbi:MAG: hypothetical protein P8019_09275 [Gammaproteobacteria bacterium]|jgi:hypothetical protein
MTAQRSSLPFWSLWLRLISAGVALFGLALVLAPGVARGGFALLLYGDAERLEQFGTEAIAYISLAHAVLGSVMLGWAVLLFLVAGGPFREARPHAWLILAVSVSAWFIPDTLFSVWSGFWPNAVLNVVLLLLFAIPLAATYGIFRE